MVPLPAPARPAPGPHKPTAHPSTSSRQPAPAPSRSGRTAASPGPSARAGDRAQEEEVVQPSPRPTQRRRCPAAASMGSLRERCARVFEACDEGNKGYLNREDFEVAVVMLFGYKLSEVEVDSIMSSVRPGNSGILFEKFLNLMSAKKSAQLHSDETREIFTAFDMQDRGFLTFEDFKKTINSVLPKLSERIIIEAFRAHINMHLHVTH
ncbi:EF-hand calcium-binding domain-containing protein 11 isoform X2 [Gallus gallus]|uniref:EF-hand calcium-binding domain-containing protein 11 isoform X2 n=1 Tax=Gallus gallus TaxID=9031 RepID=UPI001AE25F58|nr:EF-hand calcium-binding domain-containing protein 11 isoform X2 [Gallus gallus]